MGKNQLTDCDKCMLKLHVAPYETRLKKGRLLAEDFEQSLIKAECADSADRVNLFVQMVRLCSAYEQKCIKEWLEYVVRHTSCV